MSRSGAAAVLTEPKTEAPVLALRARRRVTRPDRAGEGVSGFKDPIRGCCSGPAQGRHHNMAGGTVRVIEP